MSAKVMGQVYDYVLTATEQAVLLALADHADHNGENAYPSEELLAWKTGLSERGVQKILVALRGRGVLEEQRPPAYRRPRTYRIVLGGLEVKPVFAPKPKGARRSPIKGESDAPDKGEAGAPIKGAGDDEKGAPDAGKGAQQALEGCTQSAPEPREPSVESSDEPSARVRARESTEIEIPTRPQSLAEIEKEQKAFRKEAETVWLETVTPLGSIYTDTVALKVAGQHALMALRFGTPGQILAAIRARALRETTPRRIAELTRLYVGDELQRNAIASQRAEIQDEVIEGPRLTSAGLRPIAAAARAVVAAVAS